MLHKWCSAVCVSVILSFSASQDGDQKSPKKKHKHRSDSEVSAGVGITLRPQTFCLSTVKTCMIPVVFPIGFEAGVNKYDVYSMISIVCCFRMKMERLQKRRKNTKSCKTVTEFSYFVSCFFCTCTLFMYLCETRLPALTQI